MAIQRFVALGGSTLRPSSGQNKRLSEFSFADPRSAQKIGRFDILTSKTKSFLKSWSSVAGLSQTQIEISYKKSYTLTKVFYGCSKKANQLI